MRMPLSGWLIIGAIVLSALTTLPSAGGLMVEACSVALMVAAVLRARHEGRHRRD